MTAWDLPDPWSRTPEPAAPKPPLFSVLGGNPSAEELAALTAVVMGLDAAAGASTGATLESARRAWNRRRMLSLAPKPGPGSWRRSFR